VIVNGHEDYDSSFSELFKEINEVNKQGKFKVGDDPILAKLFSAGDYKRLS